MEIDIAPYGVAAQEKANKVPSVRAWLLDLGHNHWAALPLHEMSQVLLSPELSSIPLAPHHCRDVLIFEKRILPVINVAAFILGTDIAIAAEEDKIIGLTVYQKAPKEQLIYAAIHLDNMPTVIEVEDSQLTDLPANEPTWSALSLSCFSYEEHTVPILNLAALYSSEIATEFA